MRLVGLRTDWTDRVLASRPLRTCEKILSRARKQADPASGDRRVRSPAGRGRGSDFFTPSDRTGYAGW